jgi:hypothetical protein
VQYRVTKKAFFLIFASSTGFYGNFFPLRFAENNRITKQVSFKLLTAKTPGEAAQRLIFNPTM